MRKKERKRTAQNKRSLQSPAAYSLPSLYPLLQLAETKASLAAKSEAFVRLEETHASYQTKVRDTNTDLLYGTLLTTLQLRDRFYFVLQGPNAGTTASDTQQHVGLNA